MVVAKGEGAGLVVVEEEGVRVVVVKGEGDGRKGGGQAGYGK